MDGYDYLGTIGEGTYGVVIKARQKATGQLVAIKKFKESDADDQVRKTALREIRILQSLRHENIVSLLEFFRRHQKVYLVFEYVERTLLQEMESRGGSNGTGGGLEKHDVKRIMYQLLNALAYIHQHAIIHRDVVSISIIRTAREQAAISQLMLHWSSYHWPAPSFLFYGRDVLVSRLVLCICCALCCAVL